MPRRKASDTLREQMPENNYDVLEPGEETQREQFLDRVIALARTGDRKALRDLLAPAFGWGKPVECGRGKAGTRALATFVGPLAELWSGEAPVFVIRSVAPLCKDSPPWMRQLHELLSNLNEDIVSGTRFPDLEGVPRPLHELNQEEALEIIGDIVQLQMEGRVRLQREVAFDLNSVKAGD